MIRSYFVRGVFNLLYPFLQYSMASSVFYYFSCGNDNEVVGWIAAVIIFVLGIVFIGIHFCGGEKFGYKGGEAEESSSSRRDPIM